VLDRRGRGVCGRCGRAGDRRAAPLVVLALHLACRGSHDREHLQLEPRQRLDESDARSVARFAALLVAGRHKDRLRRHPQLGRIQRDQRCSRRDPGRKQSETVDEWCVGTASALVAGRHPDRLSHRWRRRLGRARGRRRAQTGCRARRARRARRPRLVTRRPIASLHDKHRLDRCQLGRRRHDARDRAQAGSLPPESPARFSPNGRQVAYLDGHRHLRVVNSDGSNDHLATTTPAFDAQWAPNGEIVFDSSIDRRGDAFDPTYAGAPVEISIWEVTPDGTAPAPPRRLTGPYTGKFSREISAPPPASPATETK
jgi:hypothetical protein